MIAAQWGRVPDNVKVDIVLWPLVALFFAVGVGFGVMLKAQTFTRTVHVPTVKPIRSAADVQKALGAPQGQGQLANGRQCPGWQLPDGVVLVCP